MINPIKYCRKQKIILQLNPLKRYKLRKRIILSLSIITTMIVLFLTGYVTGNCMYKSEKLEIKGLYKIAERSYKK